MVRLGCPQEDGSQEARAHSPTTWEQRGPLGDLRVQTLLSSARGQRLKAVGPSEGQAAWKVLVAGGPVFTEAILGGTGLPRRTGMRGQTLTWGPLSSPTDARLQVRLRDSVSSSEARGHLGPGPATVRREPGVSVLSLCPPGVFLPPSPAAANEPVLEEVGIVALAPLADVLNSPQPSPAAGPVVSALMGPLNTLLLSRGCLMQTPHTADTRPA